MASSNITVYTCMTGDKDDMSVPNYPMDVRDGSEYKQFIDSYDRFKDNRRNSRIQKILAHQYINTRYSIYVDANIKLLITPEEIIEKYLKDADIAVFKHPNRDCLYDEATTCAVRDLDDPEIIIEQAVAYENSGYAKHKGLFECCIVIRRHTEKVEQLNNAWWAEYCRHSKRDQISFPYAVNKVGIRVNAIPAYFLPTNDGRYIRDGAFEIIPHKIPTTKDQ